ncbi:Translational repressor [Savitreella phatthalungensis]
MQSHQARAVSSSSGGSSSGNAGGPNGGTGSGRPNLRIAHRRTPSELTPLMMEQYALQQQIEMLQAQQALLQNQQATYASQNSTGSGGFVFPPPGSSMGHRRGASINQSYVGGPPPAPSTHAFSTEQPVQQPSVGHQRRGSQPGHNRRHSLALPEARRAAEKAQAQRLGASTSEESNPTNAPSQMPPPSHPRPPSPQRRTQAHGRSQSMAVGLRSTSPVRGTPFQFPPAPRNDVQSRHSHGRSQSRSIEGNWRASAAAPSADFQPGHRARASMGSSISSLQQFGQNFAFPPQPGGFNALLPPMLGQNALLQQMQQQQQQAGAAQQRKSLFSPYLPQASLPSLMSDGRLVAGVLRVNKKNRSDAYVATDILDDDIFICGSKDRNRALEGDYVAVELLDVDEVWAAKRDKEEKKKRKDNNPNPNLRRQGSIRDRPEAKKKDDVEVEGQGLLLVDEEEVSDTQKPAYAGHIVAVVERTPGQMFSGTLGLLRPSSAATKEKQDAERREREGPGATARERNQERPKIVWFKPTDKRVPLIAIPTEQAPRDFVENHENYKNRIFVASIKRWPITSLHPFGTLTEELGNMGDVAVETEALLRDSSFLTETFPSNVIDAVEQMRKEDIDIEAESRKDFRGEQTFAITSGNASEIEHIFHIRQSTDGYEVGVHVTDMAQSIGVGYSVDREAKKRGSSVKLVKRQVPMLPESFTHDVGSLLVDQDRRTVSIVFKISTDFELEDSWVGRSVVRNSRQLSEAEVNEKLCRDAATTDTDQTIHEALKSMHQVASRLIALRIPGANLETASLSMLSNMDHEEDNPEAVSAAVFVDNVARHLVEELLIRADITVAEMLVERIPHAAVLRKQSPPSAKRLELFLVRASRLGYDMKGATNLPDLLSRIRSVPDQAVRKALEIYLFKACQAPSYIVANVNNQPDTRHYGLNVPVFTHFTRPFANYAHLITHRQLTVALAGGQWNEDGESFGKSIDLCNMKSDAAKNAQQQSIHLILCSMVDRLSATTGYVIRQATVIGVAESSFDVLLPEFGVEKRVHLDQLPLHKAEFDPKTRELELYWIKGIDSATFVPAESNSSAPGGNGPVGSNSITSISAVASAAKSPPAARMRGVSAVEEELLDRKMLEIASLTIDNESALYEDDESAFNAEVESTKQSTASEGPSASLSAPTSPPPQRPTGALSRTIASSTSVPTLAEASHVPRDKPAFVFEQIERRQDGSIVQTISELSSVPVVLQADCLYKSPPLLLVRAINPAARDS